MCFLASYEEKHQYSIVEPLLCPLIVRNPLSIGSQSTQLRIVRPEPSYLIVHSNSLKRDIFNGAGRKENLQMKPIAILSIVIILASCQTSKHNGTLVPSLDRQSLYPALFNAEAHNEWCTWKPTPAEKDSSNVSTDGLFHTRLDTILNYADSSRIKAVIIFGTYRFDGTEKESCHVCSPLVSIAVAQWNNKGN
jgi:hypothetical protein